LESVGNVSTAQPPLGELNVIHEKAALYTELARETASVPKHLVVVLQNYSGLAEGETSM
jgi:hypothetical protein